MRVAPHLSADACNLFERLYHIVYLSSILLQDRNKPRRGLLPVLFHCWLSFRPGGLFPTLSIHRRRDLHSMLSFLLGEFLLPRSVHHLGQRLKRFAGVLDGREDVSLGPVPGHLYIGKLSILHRAAHQDERFLSRVALLGVRGEGVA